MEFDKKGNLKSSEIKRSVIKSKKRIHPIALEKANSGQYAKKELIKKTGIKGYAIKKIGENKYRLLLGPFKNFNTLKSSYISLNKIGFDELNIYRELK